MNTTRTTLSVVLGLAALATIALTAHAHHDPGDEERLLAHLDISVTGGTRQICIGTVAQNGCGGPAATGSETFDPGAEVELFYWDVTSGIPPAAPDDVIIRVVIDDEDDEGANQLIELHNGPEPSNGDSFTFHLTSDGTATGTPASGTLRLYLAGSDDNAVDTLDYDCSTDGDETTGASVDCDIIATGYVRSKMDVASLSCASPPSGSFFAYGPSSSESVTCTVQYTRPYAGLSHQDISLDTIRSSDESVLLDKPLRDAGTDGDQDESAVIDLTFDASLTSYGVRYQVAGDSQLVGGGYSWTVLTDTITDGTRNSDTEAVKTGLFSADPRIRLSNQLDQPLHDFFGANGAVVTDRELYNRGESATWSLRLINARSQHLDRSMTVEVRSSGGTVVDSHTGTGPTYTDTFAWAATDPATADETGTGYQWRATNTDQLADSDPDQTRLSSLYHVDAHPQKSTPLVKDDFPTEDMTEDPQYISGEDLIHAWCHVVGVRFDRDIDTGANTVDVEIRDDAGDLKQSSIHQTGADGWSNTATTTSAAPPLGSWTVLCDVAHSGNTGTATQEIAVGSALTGNKVQRIYTRSVSGDEQCQRVYLATETNNEPAPPDNVPTLNITTVDHSTDPERVVTLVDDVLMLNAVNDTATINGNLYYHEWCPDFDAGQTFDGSNSLLLSLRTEAIQNGTINKGTASSELRIKDVTDGGTLAPFMAGFVGIGDEASFTLVFWIVALWFALEHNILLGIPASLMGLADGLISGWPVPTVFAIMVYAIGLVAHWWLRLNSNDTDELRRDTR